MTELTKHYITRKDFFDKNVFTITSQRDPFWEKSAKDFAFTKH